MHIYIEYEQPIGNDFAGYIKLIYDISIVMIKKKRFIWWFILKDGIITLVVWPVGQDL